MASFLQMLGGMDYTTPPHLLQNQWRLLYQLRVKDGAVRLVPPLVPMLNGAVGGIEPMLALVQLPCGWKNYGLSVGLTDARVYQIRNNGTSNIVTQPDGSAITFERDSIYRRWGTCVHNGRLFFVNDLNQVRYTDGARVTTLANAPKGRYVQVFFDHVVVGAPQDEQWSVRWSGLHNYEQWTSKTSNEADHYICTEYQNGQENINGVTGLQLLRNLLLIYTDTAIYAMQYTGLPRVVRVLPYVTGFGNGLLHGTAALNNAQVFVDMNRRQFCALRGAEPEAFGGPIQDYFFNDLTTDMDLRQRTWSFVDPLESEVGWVYVSTDSASEFDKAVVFNYDNKTWHVRELPNVHSFGVLGWRARNWGEMEDVALNVASLPGTLGSLSESGEQHYRAWGMSDGQLIRDWQEGDDVADIVLEVDAQALTGDLSYGRPEVVKELNTIQLEAGSSNGVIISGHGRNQLAEDVLLNPLAHWKVANPNAQATFQTVAGKWIRLRFMPVARAALTDWTFYGWLDNVNTKEATR